MALTKRQKQIYDYIRTFIEEKGYSPSLEEIGRNFQLSSVATVHKHVTNLVRKGLLRRTWNQNRSIDIVREDVAPRAVEIPLLGAISAGRPIDAYELSERIEVPAWLVGHGRTYALRVSGPSLKDEHVLDGDIVIVEERRSAESGQLVLALVHGEEIVLKRFYSEGENIRLESTGEAGEPLVVPSHRVEVRGVVRGVIRRT